MQKNLEALHGLIYSQRVLHKLLGAGMTRERAYEVVQRCSLAAWESGEQLRDVVAADPENTLSDDVLAEAFEPAWYLRHVDTIYARFGL